MYIHTALETYFAPESSYTWNSYSTSFHSLQIRLFNHSKCQRQRKQVSKQTGVVQWACRLWAYDMFVAALSWPAWRTHSNCRCRGATAVGLHSDLLDIWPQKRDKEREKTPGFKLQVAQTQFMDFLPSFNLKCMCVFMCVHACVPLHVRLCVHACLSV